MQIYTGNAMGAKLEKVVAYKLGIMISTSLTFKPRKEFSQVPCVLDNGAYTAYTKGYPFPETAFLQTLDECYKLNIPLDFIVCPDIVAGGKESLDFSMEWATDRLKTVPKLALVVQDGMIADMLDPYVRKHFTHIFVGGTPDWKWRTLPGWQSFCDAFKLKCHVGHCGTLEKLRICDMLHIESVDSTNFTRNDSWHVIDEYRDDGLFQKHGLVREPRVILNTKCPPFALRASCGLSRGDRRMLNVGLELRDVGAPETFPEFDFGTFELCERCHGISFLGGYID